MLIMHICVIWSGNLNSYKEFKDSTVQLALSQEFIISLIFYCIIWV